MNEWVADSCISICGCFLYGDVCVPVKCWWDGEESVRSVRCLFDFGLHLLWRCCFCSSALRPNAHAMVCLFWWELEKLCSQHTKLKITTSTSRRGQRSDSSGRVEHKNKSRKPNNKHRVFDKYFNEQWCFRVRDTGRN